jgi:cation transport regulator ChaB
MSAAPILVDGPALLQALRVEVATWQARSLGQRALIEAANAKQMGLIASEATKLQGIYDDVISRLYAVLDRVDASRPAQSTAPQQVNTALEPKLQMLYAKATNAALTWPDRYAAVCELILAMTKQTASAQVEQAEAIYDEARRNLGGLQQVAAKLREMSFDDKEAVRVTASAVLSIEVADKLRQTFGSVDYYVEALYNAVASLQSLIVTGGQQRRCADAIAELQRLRDDLAVGLQLRHLKR